MHSLDQAIALEPLATGQYRGHTHPGYANVVGPFGGTTASLLLNAALQHPDHLGEPIAQTVHFAAPIADGEIDIEARPVRTNRSTQHWLILASQQGKQVAMATAVFAMRRDTWSGTDARFPNAVPDVQTVPARRLEAAPEFTARYDLRYMQGFLPGLVSGDEQEGAESVLWVRDEPPRPLDFPALASLCDVFVPRIMVRRQRWMPIGTVTLTSYFHADSSVLSRVGSEHVLGVARGKAYRRGYFDQTAEIWSADRQLLASSHQMVYFKDP